MKKMLLILPLIITAMFYSSLSYGDDDDWDDRGYYSRPQINNYYPPQPQNYDYYQQSYNNGYGIPYPKSYGKAYGYRGGNGYGYSRYRNFRCNRDYDDD